MQSDLEKYATILALPSNLDIQKYGFQWDGRDGHLHPIESTPLKRALLAKTNNALTLITAGSLIWTAKRISPRVDTTKILQAAEVNLCWQANQLYFDRESPKFFNDDISSVWLGVVDSFGLKGTRDFHRTPRKHTAFPPLQDTANLISMTRHVLGPLFEADYKAWLESLIERLNEIAPNPHQNEEKPADSEDEDAWQEYLSRHMGPPLPLEAANMARPFDMDNRAELYSNFLQSVDWAANPYLASPEKMKTLGYVGEPYR